MKNIKLFKYLFLTLFICCKTNSDKTKIAVNKDIKTDQDSISSIIVETINDTEQSDIEYLSEVMLINNDYPFEGEIKTLKSFIKKPDTVRKQIDDCGTIIEDSDEIWKFLNCEIEVSKTEYAFRKVDLKLSKFTIKHKNIIFSNDYTLLDFKKDFPKSFQKNMDNKKNEIVTIQMKTHPLSDDLYIFTFQNKKLIELRYFFPC